MRIISFAWTTPALLAGAKTMTRRDWKPEYAARFKAGDLIAAWDKSPRTGKGRQVATIRLTKAPYRQNTNYLEMRDWHREGFEWLENYGPADDRPEPLRIWQGWHESPRALWVVEFDLVDAWDEYHATTIAELKAMAAPGLGEKK